MNEEQRNTFNEGVMSIQADIDHYEREGQSLYCMEIFRVFLHTIKNNTTINVVNDYFMYGQIMSIKRYLYSQRTRTS
jgi:hypothetical protein